MDILHDKIANALKTDPYLITIINKFGKIILQNNSHNYDYCILFHDIGMKLMQYECKYSVDTKQALIDVFENIKKSTKSIIDDKRILLFIFKMISYRGFSAVTVNIKSISAYGCYNLMKKSEQGKIQYNNFKKHYSTGLFYKVFNEKHQDYFENFDADKFIEEVKNTTIDNFDVKTIDDLYNKLFLF